MRALLLSIALPLAATGAFAAGLSGDTLRSVRLLKHDASVWAQNQIIRGIARPPLARQGVLFVNGAPHLFAAPDSSGAFEVPVFLQEGTTTVVARVDSAGTPVWSDTLRLTLAYRLRPRAASWTSIAGRTVTLHGTIEENPDSLALTFLWKADSRNPAPLSISSATDTIAGVVIPPGAPAGEYYFDLCVRASDGDSGTARTFVTVTGDSLEPFMNGMSHARWIDSAVLYQIQPSCFATRWDEPARKFTLITAKIPELASLGVTTLWLMPVMSTTEPNEGYHTTDYFGLREDLGTEDDLHELVETAHAHGLRVILDIVPNHTTYLAPWALDASRYGTESHYYNYYQHARSSGFYKNDERFVDYGLTTYVIYYYAPLVNLNYDSPEVQRMMTAAGRYWIEKFDIDGYRVDMVWAANARNPSFFRSWCRSLKNLKPEILLLAEDIAGNIDPARPDPFALGYDVAYDWYRGFRMRWGGDFSQPSTLAAIMSYDGKGYPPHAVVLRGLENNDVDRAIQAFGQGMERFLETIQFSLPGVPMLFNGQEIGATAHPYSGEAIFMPDVPIRTLDSYSLFPFFRRLTRMRARYPALRSANFEQLAAAPAASIYACRRWEGRQNIFCLVNGTSSLVEARLPVPVDRLELDSSRVYYLSDVFNGGVFTGSWSQLRSIPVPVNPNMVRILLLDTTAVTALPDEESSPALPAVFALAQNYPNPFNPSTTIGFDMPSAGPVRLTVYDLLGRTVKQLVNERIGSGHHQVRFDASGLASGVYIYRLETGGRVLTRKMLCLK